jgi:copper chaperone
MEDSFNVLGMMCVTNCAVKVKEAALAVEGVSTAEVDFDKGVLRVEYVSEGVSEGVRSFSEMHDGVALAVQSAGYGVEWDGMKRFHLLYVKVDGMTCGHCVGTVRKAISGIDGVRHVVVSLDQCLAVVATDINSNSSEAISHSIVEAIEDVGFGAEITSGKSRNITFSVDTTVDMSNFEVSVLY